ncbi:restriction endonuclease subunit S [Nocardia farcinica]|uniref:restriction endonuclease subunit S n=1 Tax=Nocardia farcinica TaxID=37329 RepID=UPI0018936BCF|nr:restriction endonuclease subunit S [Nocardia farcinica]MBF6384149.1 restriction endonuclease subunit S [Nocardia farcinica]MBF6536509.1 restriction endonuclease subunit S [Nocardia farcinica]
MSNWPLVPLGDILAQDGQTERIANTESEKFLTIRLYGKGLVERSIGSGKTPKPFVGYRVKPGQFVYSRIDARNGAYGVVPDELDGAVCSKDFPKFDVDQQRADENYLLRLVQTRDFYRKVQDLSFGATNRQRVKEEEFLRLRIPLPPIEEQRRIAAILDHADALRAKRREALDRLDELTQSIFIDMFGDPVSNPKGWPTLRIGELAKVTTGNTPSRERDEYYGRHIEWIKSDNINTSSAMLTAAAEYLSELGASVARIAPKGSILMTCIAGSPSVIGNVAIADRPVAFNQQINAILPLNGQTWFWYEQLRLAKTLVQAASTGGMKGLVSKSKLESVALLFPPVELQQSFSTRVSEVVRFKSHHIAAVASLDALFASLQSRAFRGEL